jgi:Transposase
MPNPPRARPLDHDRRRQPQGRPRRGRRRPARPHPGHHRDPTTPHGFVQLERWANRLGRIERFGIEGTGSFAAGLMRWLQRRGHAVVEVTRPNRQLRRRRGKSDPVDAEAAARAVLAGEAIAVPKTADGNVEMLRMLRVARRSAVKARTQAANQLASLVVTAPEALRQRLRRLAPPSWSRPRPGCCPARSPPRPRPPSWPCASWPAAPRPSAPRSTGWTPSSPSSPPRPAPRCWPAVVPVPTWPAPSWWPPATTPSGCAARPPSRCCVASHPCRRPRASTPATGSTGREPRGHQRPVVHRAGPPVLRPAHPELHAPTHRRRQVQARDHPLLEALHRP